MLHFLAFCITPYGQLGNLLSDRFGFPDANVNKETCAVVLSNDCQWFVSVPKFLSLIPQWVYQGVISKNSAALNAKSNKSRIPEV